MLFQTNHQFNRKYILFHWKYIITEDNGNQTKGHYICSAVFFYFNF